MTDLFRPQLAETTPVDRLDQYIHDAQWAFEQKLDGHRVLMHVIDGRPIPVNRKGDVKKVPQPVFDAFHTEAFAGHWAFDGELLDGLFVVFDLPLVPKLIMPGDKYFERRKVLDNLFTMWSDAAVQKLPWSLSIDEKVKLLENVKAMNGEGLMLKHLDSPYYEGRRSYSTLKCKFIKDIDCFVVEVGRNNKHNIVVAVYDDTGEEVEVGTVTAYAGDGPRIEVGDVVVVQYLGWLGTKLIQPTRPRLRQDKDAHECLLSQLEISQKRIVRG